MMLDIVSRSPYKRCAEGPFLQRGTILKIYICGESVKSGQ